MGGYRYGYCNVNRYRPDEEEPAICDPSSYTIGAEYEGLPVDDEPTQWRGLLRQTLVPQYVKLLPEDGILKAWSDNVLPLEDRIMGWIRQDMPLSRNVEAIATWAESVRNPEAGTTPGMVLSAGIYQTDPDDTTPYDTDIYSLVNGYAWSMSCRNVPDPALGGDRFILGLYKGFSGAIAASVVYVKDMEGKTWGLRITCNYEDTHLCRVQMIVDDEVAYTSIWPTAEATAAGRVMISSWDAATLSTGPLYVDNYSSISDLNIRTLVQEGF